MKTSRLVCFFLLFAAVNLHAQTNAAAQPRDTTYAIVSRDANSRVWQATNWTQDASGQSMPHVHKITELGIGLCHKDGNGNYVDSSEAIGLLPDGTAAATNCATSIYFPADIGSGVIRLVTSDGKVLQNGPAYLAYEDESNMIVLSAVTNSVGQLINSNQVLYPDIFHGAGFRADLLCTVRRSGYENDLVFRQQIPTPVSVGLGTNARLELLSEWFDTPEPVQSTNALDPADGMTDVTLHFGAAVIGRGKAFLIGISNLATTASTRPGTAVYKRWIHGSNGQGFLVEAVPYRRLAPQLQQLPSPNVVAVSARRAWRKISLAQALPSRPRLSTSTKAIQLAKMDSGTGGVVLDYSEISGNYSSPTFSAGTYFVNGPVYCTGNTTIGAGAIFKYPFDSNPNYSPPGVIVIEGPLTLNTTAGSPAVFTAVDDDSVGQSMSGLSGYTGTIQTSDYYPFDQIFSESVYVPTYADPAIELTDNPDDGMLNLTNLRFRNAMTALSIPGGYYTINVANVEVENCGIGFRYGDDMGWYYDSNDDGSRSIFATNCLMASVNMIKPLEGSWYFENCTLDEYAVFNSNGSTPPFEFGAGGSFYNCILYDVPGDYSSGNNAFGVDSGISWMSQFQGDPVWDFPFQSGLLGDHYLLAGSPFIDAGNTMADQLGLYHYTTQTSQVKEANTVVDLGFHYVAMNGSGNPIDTDGDGIPDYLEDANGNGIFDAGDLANWRGTTLDTSGVLGLKVYTSLK